MKMDEVDRYLDQTWFTWIGGTHPDSAFYYRVQSPVVLIELITSSPPTCGSLLPTPRSRPSSTSIA